MQNFDRYFLHEKKVFLDNISYETVKTESVPAQPKLGCKDTIVAQLQKNGIKINFNRTLRFEPEGLFNLSVTFGVMLIFDPTTKDEIDWKSLDIAGEFRKSCPQLMSVLMSRASLLISQITSSAGQLPLVTPGAPINVQPPVGGAQ